MTERERILSLLKGESIDRLPWFGDLSYWLYAMERKGSLKQKYLGDGQYKFYKDYNVGFYLQGYEPFKPVYDGMEVIRSYENESSITLVKTPCGNLREVQKYMPDSYAWAPYEHYIKDASHLKVLKYWFKHTKFEPDYHEAQRRYELVGENGIIMCYLPKSPLMQMIAILAGAENTVYMEMDEPDEFEELMAIMEANADEAAEITLKSSAECLMIPKNLSSEVVGKRLFEKYMKPYEEKWNKRIKEAGKYSFVHMDGTLKGLIREVSAAGFRVMEALTPSPAGDLTLQEIEMMVPDDSIIWGGIPGIYFTPLVTDEEFDDFVKNTIQSMAVSRRSVLGVADQVPPGGILERIGRVHELIEIYGYYRQ